MKTTMERSIPTRYRWLLLAILFLVAVGGGGSLVANSAPKAPNATPPGSRISDTQRTTNWHGRDYPAGTTVPNPAVCASTGSCDDYELYVALPSNYTATQQISVTVGITWTNPSDDYDLYIIGPAGDVVASSGTGAGTSEQATVICPQTNITYTVRTVPYLIQSAPTGTYFGKAQFFSEPGTACNPAAPGPSNPHRDSGGIVFNTNTLVDPQRQVGEPDLAMSPNGDIYASGPWGTRTQQSFAWKSMDNGDTYHTLSRIRPDAGPGGGDTSTETDDQNNMYLTDLEALSNIATARTTDGGNTFTRNSASSYLAGVDRQWMAVDNGLTSSAADNTEFLTYRQAATGSYLASATDGTTFLPAQADPTTAMNSGAPCGNLVFDPVGRYLYLPCGRANKVEVASAHVAPSQRTGLTFTSTLAGNAQGDTSNLFPTLSTDSAGNVYVAYVDSADHNIYLTYSTDHAQTWSTPIQINGNNANTALFPWIMAGSNGRVAVAYIATDVRGDPNTFPSWFNDKPAAAQIKWYLYVNYLTGANTANPTIYQAQASAHPMNYGQVCTDGTLCIATGGDRSMADFLTLEKDNTGAMRIIYCDTTNQFHGPSVFEAHQLAGPSLFGTELNNSQPANPVSDPAGDAQYPHFGPTGAGPNYDALDIRNVNLASDLAYITVTMTISDLNATKVLPGATSVMWLTRWQVKSLGDYGEESYRIYYGGAKSTAGGAPSFFYGTGVVATGPDVGCTNQPPQDCKLVQYPQSNSTTGTFDPATGQIQVRVPRCAVGAPPNGETLYSVTGYTLGTRDTAADFYDDVDTAKAFTYTLTGQTPMLVGHVTWQGRPAQPSPLQALPISVTLKSASAEANYPAVTTDPSGFFTVSVGTLAPGTYSYRVKGPKYLANSGNVTVACGTASNQAEMGLMRAGDANDDNVVNISDFNILKATFGKVAGDPGYDDRADFTGDNRVNVQDYSLLKNNFGQAGAPPLTP